VRRRQFITLLSGAAAGWPLAARAQQAAVKRIAVLMPESETSVDANARITFFETRLKELGRTPGRNIQIDYRWAMGNPGRFRSLATELVNSAPDVLLAAATPSLAALLKATHTIPIVFVGVSEPVANGFVPSLARPGGNATGFSNLEAGFSGKWLELLKEIVPRVSRVSMMFNSTTGVTTDMFYRAVEGVAPKLGVEMIRSDVRSLEDVETDMKSLATDNGAGLIFPPEAFTLENSEAIVELANRYRLPAVYAFRTFPDAGGLVSYGIYLAALFRAAADYIDRILKGEKPGNLPVQQPTRYQLVINLKTAKALGLEVPDKLLATADEVID
jgi:putative ABC transport system substrate-binding protein